MAKNWWNKTQVVGYGHVRIPLVPGKHSYSVTTMKPKHTIRNEMRSFFLGGSNEFEDIRFIGNPNPRDSQVSFLNKFGTVTQQRYD